MNKIILFEEQLHGAVQVQVIAKVVEDKYALFIIQDDSLRVDKIGPIEPIEALELIGALQRVLESADAARWAKGVQISP